MVRFQPSFSFWPRPLFLGESRDGFAAWIIDRETSPNDSATPNAAAIQRIIDNHHERKGKTIEP